MQGGMVYTGTVFWEYSDNKPLLVAAETRHATVCNVQTPASVLTVAARDTACIVNRFTASIACKKTQHSVTVQ